MPATDRQIEINKLYHDNQCNSAAVSKITGLSVTSVNKHLFYGARNGLSVTADKFSEVAPPGWSSYARSVLHKGGEVKLVWDKIRPDDQTETIFKFLENRTPVLKKIIPGPKSFSKDLMLEWKVFDSHLGLHAWAKQTGEDYSIKHAQHLIESAARRIYQLYGNVEHSLIVFGGDNLHADNRSAVTEKSKFHLDVDNRYQKSLEAFCVSATVSIDTALSKSNHVEVKILSGNHDFHSAIAISIILKAHYRNNPRVTVDDSPAKHKFFLWGTNFFMYTHGDTAPAKRLSSYMLNYIINNNLTGIKRKLVRKGHIHKSEKVFPAGLTEEDGVIIETFPTMAAHDAYSAEGAYSSVRATVAELWHKKYGQRSRTELGVDELMEDGLCS